MGGCVRTIHELEWKFMAQKWNALLIFEWLQCVFGVCLEPVGGQSSLLALKNCERAPSSENEGIEFVLVTIEG